MASENDSLDDMCSPAKGFFALAGESKQSWQRDRRRVIDAE